jgi:hypothetical protein
MCSGRARLPERAVLPQSVKPWYGGSFLADQWLWSRSVNPRVPKLVASAARGGVPVAFEVANETVEHAARLLYDRKVAAAPESLSSPASQD